MNEKLKLKIEREIWPQCVSTLTKDTGEVIKNNFDKYKFAELVVRECIDILDKAVYLATREDGEQEYIDVVLLEHFGIDND
jgi:hypothetical protein